MIFAASLHGDACGGKPRSGVGPDVAMFTNPGLMISLPRHRGPLCLAIVGFSVPAGQARRTATSIEARQCHHLPCSAVGGFDDFADHGLGWQAQTGPPPNSFKPMTNALIVMHAPSSLAVYEVCGDLSSLDDGDIHKKTSCLNDSEVC